MPILPRTHPWQYPQPEQRNETFMHTYHANQNWSHSKFPGKLCSAFPREKGKNPTSLEGTNYIQVTYTELTTACTYLGQVVHLHVMPDEQHTVHRLHFHFGMLSGRHSSNAHKLRMPILSCGC